MRLWWRHLIIVGPHKDVQMHMNLEAQLLHVQSIMEDVHDAKSDTIQQQQE